MVGKAAQNAVIKKIMTDFGFEGVTKKRLIRLIGDNENWGRRMIGYWPKRALIAETYAMKASIELEGVLAGRRLWVFCLLEGGFACSHPHRSWGGLMWDEF